TGRRPRNHVARDVGNRDERVVERRLNMSDAALNVLFDFLFRLYLGHQLSSELPGQRPKAALLRSFHGLAQTSARAWRRGRRRWFLLLDHSALARPLAGTRIRVRTLAADRQTLAVAQTAIASEVHQALDVHRHLATQIALDFELRLDDVA